MRSIVLAPLALACGMAAAQSSPVYRCGDSYSEQPCAGGRAVAAESPTPTPQERKDTATAAQRDAKLAGELEKERLKQEARPAQLYIPPPKSDPSPEPYRSPEQKATRKLDVFTASAPGSKPPAKEAQKKKGEKKGDAKPSPVGRAAGGVLVTPR